MSSTTPSAPRSSGRLHPLLGLAAIAFVIASLAAVAAVTGVLPIASSSSSQTGQSQVAQLTPAAPGGANSNSSTNSGGTNNTTSTADTGAATSSGPVDSYGNPLTPQPAVAQTDVTPNPAPAVAAAPNAVPVPCYGCATVVSIREIRHEGHGTGIGAVGGALVGGLLGNQFGGGAGRAVMTVAGAVGGGFAGNAVEKNVRSDIEYQVHVRTDDGHNRYFDYKNPPPYQDGQRVRLGKGVIEGAI